MMTGDDDDDDDDSEDVHYCYDKTAGHQRASVVGVTVLFSFL
jgi:hypothetical protein